MEEDTVRSPIFFMKMIGMVLNLAKVGTNMKRTSENHW